MPAHTKKEQDKNKRKADVFAVPGSVGATLRKRRVS